MLTFHGHLIKLQLFWVPVCLSIPYFTFVYIDFIIFRNTTLVVWRQPHYHVNYGIEIVETKLCLAPHKRDINKLYRPRLDAAECLQLGEELL